MTAAFKVSDEQHEWEHSVAERVLLPRPFAARYAGRCRCGARWTPGAVIFVSPVRGGPPATCLDCGLADAEARK